MFVIVILALGSKSSSSCHKLLVSMGLLAHRLWYGGYVLHAMMQRTAVQTWTLPICSKREPVTLAMPSKMGKMHSTPTKPGKLGKSLASSSAGRLAKLDKDYK